MVYKQRFINPNYKSTASKNYAHIRYIATRPRVAKNEGMNHGLFGKLTTGALTEFEDWRDIARLAYQNAKKHITMYRSVVSFDEETAAELLLNKQKDWQNYIENHIMTIAEKNGIKREHLQWACALHREKNHPHIHVVFWDTSSQVKNPFTHPSIPNAIRKQMIKDTFAEKIRAFGEEKNLATADLRQISNELVDEFERHIRLLGKDKYRQLRHNYDAETELSEGFDFADKTLNEIADRVFKIKVALPKGRISYQLLPPTVKEQVDSLVDFILKQTPALQKQKDDYVQSKMQLVLLYGGGEEYLNTQRERFGAEADKIIANRILGMVKALNRLDGEYRSADYHQSRKAYYSEQILLDALSMLSVLTDTANGEYDEAKRHGELSKAARKELYLKNQDKGYEH
ncbi:MAG: MobP3 family relaxase [Oscillospiraceae bacterium]